MAHGNDTLLPAYLVVGQDSLKWRTVVERLRARIGETGDLEFNHDEFKGDVASGEEIVQACDTLPFASALRLVEVTDADKLAKADAEAVIAYLARPCESTVLALSAEKLAKNTRLYKAVAGLGSSAVIDCAPMKRPELVRALRSMAVGHGFTLSDSAAARLVDLVGEDTVRLDAELEKISLGRNGADPVGASLIDELVERTTEAKPWELVDAFSKRDLRSCLKLLPYMGSTSPYALMGMCTTRLRELACARSLSERGELSLLPATLKAPAWRVKNHARWASGFTDAELKRAFSTARDCEWAMKSGSDPDAAFRDWLVATVAR